MWCAAWGMLNLKDWLLVPPVWCVGAASCMQPPALPTPACQLLTVLQHDEDTLSAWVGEAASLSWMITLWLAACTVAPRA